MINKTAGCFCGVNKFNVLLDEKPRVFNCHCIDCRKKIGGIISIIQLRENAVDIDKSKLGTYEHSGGSGNKIKKFYYFFVCVFVDFITKITSDTAVANIGYFF